MKKELVALMLMFSLPTMLNNRHLMQKHWTYKRKRLRSEKISEKNKRNANSEGNAFFDRDFVNSAPIGRYEPMFVIGPHKQ